MTARFCGIWILSPSLTKNVLDTRLLREREREREREHMVPVKLFHIILTSMLYKQLSACTLLLCDMK